MHSVQALSQQSYMSYVCLLMTYVCLLLPSQPKKTSAAAAIDAAFASFRPTAGRAGGRQQQQQQQGHEQGAAPAPPSVRQQRGQRGRDKATPDDEPLQYAPFIDLAGHPNSDGEREVATCSSALF